MFSREKKNLKGKWDADITKYCYVFVHKKWDGKWAIVVLFESRKELKKLISPALSFDHACAQTHTQI